MKSKEQRRAEAQERQKARDARSASQQIKLARKRRGKSAKEIARLEKGVEND